MSRDLTTKDTEVMHKGRRDGKYQNLPFTLTMRITLTVGVGSIVPRHIRGTNNREEWGNYLDRCLLNGALIKKILFDLSPEFSWGNDCGRDVKRVVRPTNWIIYGNNSFQCGHLAFKTPLNWPTQLPKLQG